MIYGAYWFRAKDYGDEPVAADYPDFNFIPIEGEWITCVDDRPWAWFPFTSEKTEDELKEKYGWDVKCFSSIEDLLGFLDNENIDPECNLFYKGDGFVTPNDWFHWGVSEGSFYTYFCDY